MSINPRIAVAALSLSAAGFGGLVLQEWYSDTAVIPVQGDRPTIGFGSTYRDDGTPVQPGDTITPPKAVARSLAHIAKDETALRKCVTVPLSQAEYDVLVDHAYQYGAARTCQSDVVARLNQGRYAEACAAYLDWRNIHSATQPRGSGWQPVKLNAAGQPIRWRYDCSTLVGDKPNKVCWGVWARSQDRYRRCLAAQK